MLAPTRELAAQIATELAPLAAARRLRVHAFYGGVGFEPQRKALKHGVDIAIACPGRLADLVQQRSVNLGEVEFVVVDEADRLADMGFLPEVRRLLDATAAKRQTLLFSATLDGDVDVLIRHYQTDPVRHEVRPPDVGDVDHHIWLVNDTERTERCAELVTSAGSAIVFTRTRHGADRLAQRLGRAGVSCRRHPRRPLPGPARPVRWRRSAPERCGRWWRPTSPPGASTSTTSPAWCSTTSPPTPRTTSTAPAAPAGPARVGMVVTLAPHKSRGAAVKLAAAAGVTAEVSSPSLRRRSA